MSRAAGEVVSRKTSASEVLLRGATVVTLDPDRRILRGDVLVRGSRIAAVARPGRAPRAARGVKRRTIDLSEHILLPGLVQSHLHLCQTLLRGMADDLELLPWLRERVWPLEAAHTPATLRFSADLGCAELLLGGTTAILDMGTVHHHDQVFAACRDAGLRTVSGKAMMDAGVGVPRGLKEKTRDSVAAADRLRDRWHGAEDGRLRYAYAPRFVLSCTERLLRAVAERVADGGRVHTHASENATECRLVREQVGDDNVAWLHTIGLGGPQATYAHCVHLTARERRMLARAGTHVSHCPSSNLKLASGVADVPKLWAAGVSLSLGADGAPCNNNMDAWTELRLAAQLAKFRGGPTALPARHALELATLGGARALGLEAEIGSVEVGKRADLVAVRFQKPHVLPISPDLYGQLVYATRSSDVRWVMVDGREVVVNGGLRTLDVEALRAKAPGMQRRLVRRAGLG